MLRNFYQAGRASFIVGGQFGSEGKGAAAAFVARYFAECELRKFHIVTTNAGAQAGHTSVHNGKRRVVFHLPTAPLIMAEYGMKPTIYLNAGSVIDPDVLMKELNENHSVMGDLIIHPNAAVIDGSHKRQEEFHESPQTRIASTRKGVGAALASKVMRDNLTAREHPITRVFTWYGSLDLNREMQQGKSVLVEVPQGYSLGLDAGFYPYCTSRNCTPMQAMSDAGIHPSFYGASLMALRTYPIRVGSILAEPGDPWAKTVLSDVGPTEQVLGWSGPVYPDQYELTWADIGQKPEYTTVTGRMRRLFTFSFAQTWAAMKAIRPDVVYLTFWDYLGNDPHDYRALIPETVLKVAHTLGLNPEILLQSGPTTDDVQPWEPPTPMMAAE